MPLPSLGLPGCGLCFFPFPGLTTALLAVIMGNFSRGYWLGVERGSERACFIFPYSLSGRFGFLGLEGGWVTGGIGNQWNRSPL
ncbi:hypothetical protein BS50DRAFT_181205 [Corynespora cassiicola Philippines]|uniref:Uncharacterized protein n=1 Tax=Corynespora cassiicola Philippines TaxID=1448308 RepID=A0A2T2P671_CORCC|nr:hypothetical protein BS50DRAFT_181205 [Corynespora cassiicola Philippines]